MFSYGKKSEGFLATCHPKIQKIFRRALELSKEDISILCGERGEALQNSLFDEGKSQLRFPNSKHNSSPSRAVDAVPYPVDWDDEAHFFLLASYVFKAANELEIKINWGGHWPNFKDLPHWELDKSEE